jgi:hypothetical protein
MSMTLVESTFVESNIVVAAKDQIGCNLGEEEIILDLASGVYYGLNNVGSRIWELVQKPITVGEIVDTVLSEYDAEPTDCAKDIRNFLAEMAERGLLEQNS